ncbi:MAG TPA: multiheme c-type cytochrome, partial [Polyangiaceae bacterium]|nr:multiheme c-type cytochrome [Polyangiaceae bacterium]
MQATSLARERKLTERHAPWIVLTTLAALGTALVAIAIDRGALAEFEYFPAIMRGYTLVGSLLGISAAACCMLTFAYSLRKRGLQEHWPIAKGTLAGWLWAHVYFGVLSLVLALCHAGYGVLSFQLSTGKALFLTLVLIVSSGVVWRAIYAVVPARVAEKVGNYSFQASAERAQACQVEIEKLAAGRSQAFHQLTEWVLAQTPAQAELQGALFRLAADEQGAFSEVATLAAARREALSREREQKGYIASLSRMRILHVPLSLLLFVLLPLHVVYAFDLPAKVLPPGAIAGAALGGFQRSEVCADCHGAIYAEWKKSMHAHAMTGPIMVAQNNEVISHVLGSQSPDLQKLCVNCHGPVGAALAEQPTLPLTAGSLGDAELMNEGIACSVCHQWNGEPHTGGAGLVAFQDDLEPGRAYYGPFVDAVGN